MDVLGEIPVNVLRARVASCELERAVLLVEIRSATTSPGRRKEAFTEYTGVLMNIRQLHRAILEIENPERDTSDAGHA